MLIQTLKEIHVLNNKSFRCLFSIVILSIVVYVIDGNYIILVWRKSKFGLTYFNPKARFSFSSILNEMFGCLAYVFGSLSNELFGSKYD